MSSSRKVGYRPRTVEVFDGDATHLFKIFPDGTIYKVKQTVRNPRSMNELLESVANKKGRETGSHKVVRETLVKVVEPSLQKIVFHKYLTDLQKEAENDEDDAETQDQQTTDAQDVGITKGS